jgi:hypothetical protein
MAPSSPTSLFDPTGPGANGPGRDGPGTGHDDVDDPGAGHAGTVTDTSRFTHDATAVPGLVVMRVDRMGWSTRVHARAISVTLVVLVLAFGVFAWSLTLGDFPIALTDVLRTLAGRGERQHEFVVETLRLPRGLAGLLVGAAFGLSGAIFQRITRNPLASPDIIGVNAGAATAGVWPSWSGTPRAPP